MSAAQDMCACTRSHACRTELAAMQFQHYYSFDHALRGETVGMSMLGCGMGSDYKHIAVDETCVHAAVDFLSE